MPRLNLGCGNNKRKGYLNIDWYAPVNPDRCEKIENLRFAEKSVDEIYASHVVEHLALSDFRTMLYKFYDWLVDGGKLSIAVPDMKVLGELLVSGDNDTIIFKWIFGNGKGGEMSHKWGFTENTLRNEVERVGFKYVGKFPPQNDDSGFYYKDRLLSLNLEFEK